MDSNEVSSAIKWGLSCRTTSLGCSKLSLKLHQSLSHRAQWWQCGVDGVDIHLTAENMLRGAVSHVARGAKPSSVLRALLLPSAAPYPPLTPSHPFLPHLLSKIGRWDTDTIRLVALLPRWRKLPILPKGLPSSLWRVSTWSATPSEHRASHMCLGGVAHENASPVGGDRVHSVPPLGAQLPKAGFHQSCIIANTGEICSSGSRILG